jgi:hypothetical protein
MNAKMNELMKKCYTVPEKMASEAKAYELTSVLRRELKGSQLTVLELLFETCVDWVGDVEEAAFVQGVVAGSMYAGKAISDGESHLHHPSSRN